MTGNGLITSNFVDLLPPNLKEDPDSIAIGKAFDSVFNSMFPGMLSKLIIYANIDNAGDEVLDVLAPDLHVDVYDKTWSLEKKRSACKNSQIWHVFKGTADIVKDVAKPLVGGASIKEWSEYNGLSHHFKVLFDVVNEAFNEVKIDELIRIANKYKNLRSKIDEIEYTTTSKADVNFLSLLTMAETVFIPSLAE